MMSFIMFGEESPGSTGQGWFLTGTAGQKKAGKESAAENRLPESLFSKNKAQVTVKR